MNLFNQLGDFFSNVGEQATFYSLMAKMYALHQKGQFTEAIELAEQALNLANNIWENEHPDVAMVLNNLAILYESQGKYREAENFYQQSLDLTKHLFNNNDAPNLAGSINNLAVCYDAQGKYSQAEPLFQQSLAMRKRLFKKAHPDIASSLNNLGLLYTNQGKYSQAEPLFLQSLAMRKHLFKKAHPDIASSLNNLGLLYTNQGKFREYGAIMENRKT